MKKIYVVLILIFLFAFFLRLYKLSNFPVGFHIDEASLGYNGYSMLLTGKDESGKSFPLYIDMFGDYRPSGYHYLTIAPVAVFGLTEFATRFPSAVFGSLLVFAVYFFVVILFSDKKLGLLASFLIAVAPWSIVLSRASDEAVVALFFIIVGFGLFFYSLEKKKPLFFITGFFSLTLSLFFYHTPRVFVPGILLVFLLFFFKKLKALTKNFQILLGVGFLALSGLALFLVFGISGGTGRYSQVNIFSSFETKFYQTQQLQEDAVAGSSLLESRLFHNKLTNIGFVFVSNYFDYFGLNFLFTKGGLPVWYSIPRVGLIYLIELPFILIGVYSLLRHENRNLKIPLLWILAAPVVPAITMDDVPNINRAIMLFPMLDIAAAYGFFILFTHFRWKRMLLGVSLFLIIFNFVYFLHQYYYNAKTEKPWYRNNGFKSMMDIVRKNYHQYDVVAMSKFQGGIYPLVLFYMRYDPALYQSEGSPKTVDYGGFGKFFFVPQDCPSVQATKKIPASKKVLYIDKGDCPWDNSLPLRGYSYIYREDGTRVFRIVYE